MYIDVLLMACRSIMSLWIFIYYLDILVQNSTHIWCISNAWIYKCFIDTWDVLRLILEFIIYPLCIQDMLDINTMKVGRQNYITCMIAFTYPFWFLVHLCNLFTFLSNFFLILIKITYKYHLKFIIIIFFKDIIGFQIHVIDI